MRDVIPAGWTTSRRLLKRGAFDPGGAKRVIVSGVQALILAAGLGTRLWPLTADRAKPAVPFIGRPLVASCAALLAKHGFARAVVNTHYRAESVRAALADAPLAIDFSHEEQILGTAGAIAFAIESGRLDRDQPLLVLNGKLSTDLDLRAAMDAHVQSRAAVTMVLRTNAARERFKEVLTDGDRVTGFGAMIPESARARLFTGVHVLSPEVMAAIPRGVETDTIQNTYPPFIAAGRVHAHVDDGGRWWELSTLERYVALHSHAAALGLCGPQVLGPRATIAASAKIGRAVLWEDAVIGEHADVDEVVVGAGAAVRPGEVLRRTVVIRRDLTGDVERGVVDGDRVLVQI